MLKLGNVCPFFGILLCYPLVKAAKINQIFDNRAQAI